MIHLFQTSPILFFCVVHQTDFIVTRDGKILHELFLAEVDNILGIHIINCIEAQFIHRHIIIVK